MKSLIAGAKFSFGILLALLPVAATAEVTLTPVGDWRRVVIVKPRVWPTPEEKLDQLRSLSTARCFGDDERRRRGANPGLDIPG
jgi:hypothetical protein